MMNGVTENAPPGSCEELLAQMIAFETVNPRFGGGAEGEMRLVEFLEQLARDWRLEFRRCPVPEGGANLLITCEVDPRLPWLIFESHLDTVSVSGMSVDPFVAKIEGDRIYGRGSCDTKGSGAAMLWALRAYARSSDRPRNVALAFTVDEECRMTGARALAAGELRRFLPRLEGVIVGEPTSLQPVVAHNGVVRWKTITRGVAAHSSVPQAGRSAISAMLRVVDILENEYVRTAGRSHPLTGRAAFSVNLIRGGTQVNIIPDYCEIECDRRTVPGENIETLLAERDALLAGHAVEHAELYVVPPLGESRDRWLFERLQQVLRAHGCDATPRGAPYVTNASHYADAGASTLVLGPGEIAQAHTRDEWISRRQLSLAVEIYGGLMSGPRS